MSEEKKKPLIEEHQSLNSKQKEPRKDNAKTTTAETTKKTEQKPTTDSSKSKSAPQVDQRLPKKSTKIVETGSGYPTTSKPVTKLTKATPYEFISAWNALKKAETVEPYYDLLKQIKPSEIKTGTSLVT